MANCDKRLRSTIQLDGAAKHLLKKIDDQNGDIWPINDKHPERCEWTPEAAKMAVNITKPRSDEQ